MGGTTIVDPVDHHAERFFKHQGSNGIGNWQPFSQQFAEMLVLFVVINFEVVENLAQLGFNHR